MTGLATLRDLKAAGKIRALDYQLGRLVAGYAGEHRDAVALAAALASYELGRGNVCVDLRAWHGRAPFDVEDDELAAVDAERLAHALRLEASVCCAAGTQRPAPLVLDGERLYFHRYWRHESELAGRLAALAARRYPAMPDFPARLTRLFPPGVERPDRQKAACAIVLTRGLGIVTGGPGTGKTSTVARLLVLMLEQARAADRSLVIRLAAPTGKAAARVTESLGRQLADLQRRALVSGELAAQLPAEAQTLHRLLGARADGSGFQYHAGNPLPVDVLVIDESSMIDLRMAAAIVAALPGEARLVLLGDKDQLASVEAGNVFGELCSGAGGLSPERRAEIARFCGEELPARDPKNRLSDATALLEYSHRFSGSPGIGRLAHAVNDGDFAALQRILAEPPAGVVVNRHEGAVGATQLEVIVAGYRPYLAALADCAADAEVLALRARFQVLCALRDGEFGVRGLNRAIEAALEAAGLLRAADAFYPGRPVMISRNDHALRLYNGDVGVVVRGESGRPVAAFAQPDGGIRRIAVSRLPEHESAYAMTVHKSQGSEFDEVFFLLPPAGLPAAARLLRRELLYTGVTRARERLVLALEKAGVAPEWLLPTERRSGLSDRLAAG